MVSVDIPIPLNADEYTYGTTRNDPDSATVELRYAHNQTLFTSTSSNGLNLVVALLWRFPNHHDSSRITTVLLQFTAVHHDGATRF